MHRPVLPETININLNANINLNVTLKVEPPPPSSRAGVWMTIRSGGLIVKGKSPMVYTLPVGMMIAVQVTYVDAKGNPAVVDGDTTWTSSDDTIATVVPDSTDSTKAEVSSVDLGQAQITTHADADLGSGTRDIIGVLDLQVVAGEAVAVQITPVGDAQPIPDSSVAAVSSRRAPSR